MTRRQALLAVFAVPMAQLPEKGQPGTIIIDLRRLSTLVIIGSDFNDGQITLSGPQIFEILKGA